jgi:hypothetical protein
MKLNARQVGEPMMIRTLLTIFVLGVPSVFHAALPSFRLEDKRTSGAAQAVPVTFGQVFAPGDVPSGLTLQTQEGLLLQVDPKATHADGSLRHAVLSIIPTLTPGERRTMHLQTAAPAVPGTPPTLAALLGTSFDSVVSLNNVEGADYQASARALLQQGAPLVWLSSGPLCVEWLVSGPFRRVSDGMAHPHLQARFAIRAYQGLSRVRADITIENGWAYEQNPRGFTYNAVISVPGETSYTRTVAHTHHTRWRRVIWWGANPAVDIIPDRDYLLSTKSVPHYDTSVNVSASALAGLPGDFDPMSNGNLTSYMPTTGSHRDIGPFPDFSALYVLSMDPRARANVLANGAAGGSYQVHYRNKATDLPVTLDEYPIMTLNPQAPSTQRFPAVTGGLDVHHPDGSHQPSIAYLPYLISGDYFFLEELQFWAERNLFESNPQYRNYGQGLLRPDQVRGQAWGLRTLAHAAYITPDAHPLKEHFTRMLANNLTEYTSCLMDSECYFVPPGPDSPQGVPSDAPKHNVLGWMNVGPYSGTDYKPYGIAPWQDDFFTWAVGHVVDLGFTQAERLRDWKSRFVVGRMTDPGFCWLEASAYELQIGTASTSGVYRSYGTFAEVFNANFPNRPPCTGTAMTGYPDGATGYPANMQPALAAAVDAGIPDAAGAWARYETRNPRQDQEYSSRPQFAVVPRSNGSPLPPSSLPARPQRLRVR